MGKQRTGSVTWRAGRWWARIRLLDGSRPEVPLKGPSEGAARAEALGLQTLADAGKTLPRPGGEVLTFGQWVETGAAPHDRTRLARFRAFWDTPLPRLTPPEVRAALDVLPSVLSPLTRRHMTTSVKRVLAGAVKAGKLRASPFPVDLPAPRKVAKLLQCLWGEDARALFWCQHVPAHRRQLWAVLTYTGLRVGELAALRTGDVDPRRGLVTVRRAWDRHGGRLKGTKSGSPRQVVAEAALHPVLVALTAQRTLDVPLVRLPKRAEHLAKLLRSDLARAGVRTLEADEHTKGFRVHDLRATYISWRLARGDAPMRVRDAAGHSAFSQTEVYYRSSLEGGPWFPELPPDLSVPAPGLCST
jgi:integrase